MVELQVIAWSFIYFGGKKMTLNLESMIKAAAKKKKADLVIKNGRIIDVFNLEIIEADIAINDGMIIGLGQYEGIEEVDANGAFICPGLIDGHVHMESSMIHPYHFTQTILEHGVTTIVTDPHEIANVSGTAGIQFMLDATEKAPVDVFFMLPSCVPATSFEHNGASIQAEDLAPLYEHDRVIGLAEVMDFPAVRDGNAAMIAKLTQASRINKKIDGHGAGLAPEDINIYASANIKTDHECVTAQEAKERLKRGMYVMMREGTVAKDVRALIPLVNERNARRFLFCTDDKHLDDLVNEGSIDHNVRISIQEGLDPLLAIQIATLNAAECFSLTDRGAVAPGYRADLLFIDNLENFTIKDVYKNGIITKGKGPFSPIPVPNLLQDSVNMKPINKDDLKISVRTDQPCNMIEIIPNSLVTKHIKETVTTYKGEFISSIDNDQLKLAVIERHKCLGHVGLGIVKGFQIKNGAIASTVAHDSHNIVTVGTSDEDMLVAVKAMEQINGGLVVVCEEKVVASLPLEISGLMANLTTENTLSSLKELHEALHLIGSQKSFNPFVALSFLSLPVIPELKLTDTGLFDVRKFEHIPIQAK
ncbi:adenine deaminase [Sutcliffiella horikoshii]|uniref:Adenine deaminase n=1 Tax=Sutcliffiella horikoshii TaxID=79883 RepID=A0A5D4SNI8_9BACI|nr:adenine deaminase [Sutcliffiella horikoshii]TYS64589.1 adenine deaminase [Sutcliffiella horikoshii]